MPKNSLSAQYTLYSPYTDHMTRLTLRLQTYFRYTLLSVILGSSSLYAEDAEQLLSRITATMQKVKDYSASVTITPDIPLVNIQPVEATVYFKTPNSFQLESKSIAILPKQGFMELNRIVTRRDLFSAVATGSENVANHPAKVLTLLPKSDTMDVILAKLWVDESAGVVLKAQITTRSAGTINVEYLYGGYKAFGLPDKITFIVDVKKFKLPKGVTTDFNRSRKAEEEQRERKSGTISISLSNYKVNKGLSDEIFKKK